MGTLTRFRPSAIGLRSDRTAHRGRAVLVAGLCGMLLGCGGVKDAPKSVPIKGRVTYKDQPISAGEVVYTPVKEGAGRMARGGINPDGSYQLRTSPSVPGVVPGDYAISLVAMDNDAKVQNGPSSAPVVRPPTDRTPKAAKATIPQKYLSPDTSGLKETVDDAHTGTTDIVLTD